MRPLLLGYDALGRQIRIKPEDRRTHAHVVGSSGSGKSKFLESMIRGDIQNRQGFCLIDPHGRLYEDVLSYCAHHVIDRDIILLNLSEPTSVIGFNPFQRVPDGDVAVQVDRRITATMHAWNVPDTDSTPTLARTLRLIYTVMLERNLGLQQVSHLIDFDAKQIRTHLIKDLETPLVEKEWRELQFLRSKEWRDETLSARNRLFKLLTSRTLARFMGIPGHSIDLAEVIEQGKILLVNLAPSDDLSSDNARVFGALLVNEFFETARRRKRDALGGDPAPYYLYIDEFQEFVSLDISKMLDQVRKFGLFTILAHQRFGQLTEDLIDGLSNCGIKAVFGGLPVKWARYMAEELFIRELDLQKIKVAIYQTKFWPEYRRDKVYSQKERNKLRTKCNGRRSGSLVSPRQAPAFGATRPFCPTHPLPGTRPCGSPKTASPTSSVKTLLTATRPSCFWLMSTPAKLSTPSRPRRFAPNVVLPFPTPALSTSTI